VRRSSWTLSRKWISGAEIGGYNELLPALTTLVWFHGACLFLSLFETTMRIYELPSIVGLPGALYRCRVPIYLYLSARWWMPLDLQFSIFFHFPNFPQPSSSMCYVRICMACLGSVVLAGQLHTESDPWKLPKRLDLKLISVRPMSVPISRGLLSGLETALNWVV